MGSVKKMIDYAKSRWHEPKYVMGGGRIGKEADYYSNTDDCSSYVYKCLKKGDFIPETMWNGSTEDLFRLARKGKYLKEISYAEVRQGDIFVKGVEGASGGAYGHTGIFLRKGEIIHCNAGSNWTVTTNDESEGYWWYLDNSDYPVRFFRPVGASDTPKPKKSIKQLANEVIDGNWGVGSDRKKRLESAGYSYKQVQDEVNKQLKNKSVYHTVKSGDSLKAIAKRYGVSLDSILKKNSQIKNPNIIYPGEKIRIK